MNMDANKRLAFILLVFIGIHSIISAKNILGLFPHHGYSHFEVYYPILLELAERGHHVTVITYFKAKDRHANYTEYILTGKKTKHRFSLQNYTPSRSLWAMWNEFWQLFEEGQESCNMFYESGFVEMILERHTKNPFHLIITEFFNTDCHLGVASVTNLNIVGLSSCVLMPWIYDRIALPDNPSYIQSEFIGFPEPLNVFQRAINFIQSKGNKILYNLITVPADNAIIENKLHTFVNVKNFVKNRTSLIFVNQHYSLIGNRPSTPQLIEIGGIHINERKIHEALPKDISDFLQDVPKKGVLFISWGSNLMSSSIPLPQLESIVSVLQELPIKVIWKWESNELPTKSKKFLFLKWVPQQTLLCHPKIKVFWGHGGLLGTTEAIYCSKPLILTPIYGDQFLNANAVANRGVGKILFFDSFNNLNTTLMSVLKDDYRIRVEKLSKIFRNRPMSPKNLSIWWIEHLLREGEIAHKLLKTHAVNLDFMKFYSLDLLLYSTLITIFIFKIWSLYINFHTIRIYLNRESITKFSLIMLLISILAIIIYPMIFRCLFH